MPVFLDGLLSRSSVFVFDDDLAEPLKSDIRELQTVLSGISSCNFGCAFVKGNCEAQRRKTEWCCGEDVCCGGCANNYGYMGGFSNLNMAIIHVDQLAMYESLFNSKAGFLTKTGCRLSVGDRSEVCRSFHCASSEWNMTRDDLVSLEVAINEFQTQKIKLISKLNDLEINSSGVVFFSPREYD